MQRPRRYRLSGRRRLAIGLAALAFVALVCFGLGRLLAGSETLPFPASLWSLLGVRMASPEPADGPEAEARPPSSGPATTGPGPSEGTGGPSTAAADRIAQGATIVRIVDYEQCGDPDTTSTAAESGLVGLSREALALELRDWEIVSFAPDRVELKRVEVAGWCRKHTPRTLKLENGELILYAGSLGDQPPSLIVIKPTGFSESDLGASEAAILREGKTFESDEDVVQYLEGLSD